MRNEYQEILHKYKVLRKLMDAYRVCNIIIQQFESEDKELDELSLMATDLNYHIDNFYKKVRKYCFKRSE